MCLAFFGINRRAKNYQMKKSNRKRLAKGLRRIQAKFYSDLSETEHQFFDLAIAELKKKTNWIKPVRRILKTIVKIMMKMF